MTRGPGLLVVDDEPDMAHLVRETLRQSFPDIQIETAEGVPEALRTMRDVPIHLVLSDYRMLGPDGLDLLRHVRGRVPRPRFVLMTAFADSSLEARAEAVGADAFLRKPLDVDLLIRTCRRLLDDAVLEFAGP